MAKSTSMPMAKEKVKSLKIKPTTPPIKSKGIDTKNVPSTGKQKTPKHARRVWNKVRPKRAVSSTIAKFSDGGKGAQNTRDANLTPHLAPGVPRTSATKKGYLPPGAKTKKTRGAGDYSKTLATTYPPDDHAGAGYS